MCFQDEILYCKQKRRRSGTNKLKVNVPQTSSNPCWDFSSSEALCRPSMKGLYWEVLLFQNGLNLRLSSEWVRVCLGDVSDRSCDQAAGGLVALGQDGTAPSGQCGLLE